MASKLSSMFGTPSTSQTTSSGGFTPGTGQISSLFNPTVYTGSNAAPTYNINDPASQAALIAGNASGAGWVRSGVNAFLPGDINYMDLTWGPNSGEGGNNIDPEMAGYQNSLGSQLTGLAQQLGYDTSGYNLNSWNNRGLYSSSYAPWEREALDQAGIQDASVKGNTTVPTANKDLYTLYNDMNSDLSNFARYRGASSGWTGSSDPRQTAETLYYQNSPGTWSPISQSQMGHHAEHRGWAREDGSELLTGLSMVMPAFGGWGGILGNGVGGTLTAGSGLGLTGSLGNIGNFAANVLGNSLMTGSTPSLTSLLGSAAPGVVSSLASGSGLANAFGNAANVAGSSNYSSLGQLMNSGIGQAIRGTAPYRAIGAGNVNSAMGTYNTLARLFS